MGILRALDEKIFKFIVRFNLIDLNRITGHPEITSAVELFLTLTGSHRDGIIWKLLTMGRGTPSAPEPARWIPPKEKRKLLGAADQAIDDTSQGRAVGRRAGGRGVREEEEVQCVGCLGSRGPDFELPCGHWWCAVCLQECIRVGLQSAALWPPRCCRPLTEDVLSWVQRPGWVQIWRQVREEQATPPRERVYCAQRSCADFIPIREDARRQWSRGRDGTARGGDGNGDGSAPSSTASSSGDFLECLACGERTCRRCKAAAHPGRPCTVEEEDEELMDYMDRNNLGSCPVCHRITELRDGCNHIRYDSDMSMCHLFCR